MSKIMENFGDNEDETLVSNSRVSCDGGVLGHPKIYLDMGRGKKIVCPYCSKLFVLENNN